MGPPAFAGGNHAGRAGNDRRGESFNGATGFRRWKHVIAHCRISVRIASMGPPAFAGGNACRRAASTAGAGLQWGHRLSPVETSLPSASPADFGSLQWGHRLSPVETACCRRSRRRVSRRFNGATGFRRWKPVCAYLTERAGKGALQWGHRLSPVETHYWRAGAIFQMGFNGATGFRRWKPDWRKRVSVV